MVEKWLLQVQHAMIQSLKDVSAEAVKAYPDTPRKSWVLEWPGQIVIAASSIYWTEEVTDAITNGTMKVRVDELYNALCCMGNYVLMGVCPHCRGHIHVYTCIIIVVVVRVLVSF